MAMGETIGYCQNLMVNNNNTYYQHFAIRNVHIALMGDPTLRMYVISPPSNLQLTEVNNRVELSWTASADNVLGYQIFRKDSVDGIYNRVNQGIISGTAYTDSFFESNGDFNYSVRAVKLEESMSGTFYNLSGGSLASIQTIYTSVEERIVDIIFTLNPNPAKNIFTLTYSGFEPGFYKLCIENSIGQKLKSINVQCENNGNIEIDISNIPQGVYIVSLRNANGNHSDKLLISH